MSVFVLEDLCFSFKSLPPNEAMVPVVSNVMMGDVAWCDRREDVCSKGNGLLGALISFVNRLMSDVALRLVRGGGRQLQQSYPTPPCPWAFDLK